MKPVYMILGAANGIGSTLCRQLAGNDSQLALAGRTQASLAALRQDVGGSTHVLDATSVEAVEHAVSEVSAQHGRLDGIVNCVGSVLLEPAHRTSADEWRNTLAANLDTAFAAVRVGAGAMRKEGGSIVLLSSAAFA